MFSFGSQNDLSNSFHLLTIGDYTCIAYKPFVYEVGYPVLWWQMARITEADNMRKCIWVFKCLLILMRLFVSRWNTNILTNSTIFIKYCRQQDSSDAMKIQVVKYIYIYIHKILKIELNVINY